LRLREEDDRGPSYHSYKTGWPTARRLFAICQHVCKRRYSSGLHVRILSTLFFGGSENHKWQGSTRLSNKAPGQIRATLRAAVLFDAGFVARSLQTTSGPSLTPPLRQKHQAATVIELRAAEEVLFNRPWRYPEIRHCTLGLSPKPDPIDWVKAPIRAIAEGSSRFVLTAVIDRLSVRRPAREFIAGIWHTSS